MGTKARRKEPELIIREGKPAAVILDLKEYQKLLERLEDAEDLAWLRAASKRKSSFRKLDDFLAEFAPDA